MKKYLELNPSILSELLSNYQDVRWLSVDSNDYIMIDAYIDDVNMMCKDIVEALQKEVNESNIEVKVINQEDKSLFEQECSIIRAELNDIDELHGLTDLENAQYILEYVGAMIFKCSSTNTIFVYNETNGTFDTDEDAVSNLIQRIAMNIKKKVKAIATEAFGLPKDAKKRELELLNDRFRHLADSTRKSKIIKELKSLIHKNAVSIDELNSVKDHIVVENGVVDMKNGELLSFSKNERATRKATVKYDKDAVCPKFEKFINEVFCGDKELAKWFQMFLGYAMSGHTSEQIYIVGQGNGANGKGTLARILFQIMGNYCNVLSQEALSDSKNSEASPELTALAGGVRMAICQELPRNYYPKESLIKSMTGEDKIRSRSLYSNGFEFTPIAKILTFTNFLPRVTGDDQAMMRRTFLIPFLANFNGRINQNIDNELLEEKSGILNWMIKGFQMWNQNKPIKNKIPRAMQEAKDEWQNNINQFEQYIMNNYELVVSDKSTNLKVSDIVADYNQFELTEQIITDKKYGMKKQNAVEKLNKMFNSCIDVTKPKNIDTARNLRKIEGVRNNVGDITKIDRSYVIYGQELKSITKEVIAKLEAELRTSK